MPTQRECHLSAPGPWGLLEYFYTFLDPPESFFSGPVTRTRTEWVFLGETRSSVNDFLLQLGVSPARFERNEYWLEARNGVVLRPPDDYLEEMPPSVGAEIARRVLQVSGDSSHLNEFIIERGRYREYTEGLDIPGDLIAWTEERCFRMAERTIFASTPHALSRISDPKLRIRFLKSLARCRSLMARLRIQPGQDLQAIARWWTAGPNRTRALPLLEAALDTRGVETIDLLHLLPPVPRRLLNTYPVDRDRFWMTAPDCYWAAMNFFESTASNRYLDDHLPRTYYFADRFERVTPPYEFGDVIMLCDSVADKFHHAYVYIADDIVYTKNGSGRFFPFVLMRREDMLTRYVSKDGLTTEAYRIRSLN